MNATPRGFAVCGSAAHLAPDLPRPRFSQSAVSQLTRWDVLSTWRKRGRYGQMVIGQEKTQTPAGLPDWIVYYIQYMFTLPSLQYTVINIYIVPAGKIHML